MLFRRALSLSALVASLAAAAPKSTTAPPGYYKTTSAPGGICTRAPYKAFLPLSNNGCVESFCSSAYPVAAVTSTSTASTTTTVFVSSTLTAISSTTTTSVSTDVSSSTTSTTTTTPVATSSITDTVTASSTTTSTTTTATITTTIVTSAGGTQQYRRAAPTRRAAAAAAPESLAALDSDAHLPDSLIAARKRPQVKALRQQWDAEVQSFRNKAGSFISTACSCLETPSTIHVTTTATLTATSHVTVTQSSSTTIVSQTTTSTTTVSTAISTESVTATSLTTTTTTTTSISIAPTSAVVVDNACDKNVPGPSDGAQITVQCGQIANNGATQISQSTAVTFYQCLSQADANGYCTSFNYQFSTRTCTLFHDSTPAYNSVANADYVFGHFNNG